MVSILSVDAYMYIMHIHIIGEDYEPGPYNVIIPAEMTSALFNITITNDDINEGNETFNLVVNVSSLSSNVTVGETSQTTITIMNDDGKQCKTTIPLLIYNFIIKS